MYFHCTGMIDSFIVLKSKDTFIVLQSKDIRMVFTGQIAVR